MKTDAVFFVHLLCCFYMLGVIALIQLIHYPAFERMDDQRWVEFHGHHTRTMGYLVGPVMIVELVSGWLVKLPFEFWLLNIFLLAGIWGVTFLKSVPSHNRLATGKTKEELDSLLRWNWVRSFLWISRAVLLVAFVHFE